MLYGVFKDTFFFLRFLYKNVLISHAAAARFYEYLFIATVGGGGETSGFFFIIFI